MLYSELTLLSHGAEELNYTAHNSTEGRHFTKFMYVSIKKKKKIRMDWEIWKDYKCLQNFDQKTWREENIWET